MKSFTEEDLIAYHMHELSPRRARALVSALETDAALATEFEAYATMLQGFRREEPMRVEDEVLERSWLALRPSLTIHQVPAGTGLRWLVPALAGGGIVFASTLAFVATHHHKAVPMLSPESTAVVRRPSRLERPLQPQKELRADASPQLGRVGRGREEQGKAPSVGGAPQDPHEAAQSRISYLSLARTPGQAPEFIPLAKLPMPALPPQTAVPGVVVPGIAVPEAASQGVTTGKTGRSKRRHSSPRYDHPADLTFAMGGTLIGTRQGSSSGALENFQGASHAVSAVAAFHQQLRPAVGYRLTFSSTRPEFAFTSKSTNFSYGTTYVNSRVVELAGTYVVQGPHRGRLSTFVEAGAGLMSFVPTVAAVDTHSNLRGAAVFGVGAEVALTKRLALHGAYRGQVFQGPDFKANGPIGPYVTSTLFSNEPIVGITYRFVHK